VVTGGQVVILDGLMNLEFKSPPRRFTTNMFRKIKRLRPIGDPWLPFSLTCTNTYVMYGYYVGVYACVGGAGVGLKANQANHNS
jgi:hypothetical protein